MVTNRAVFILARRDFARQVYDRMSTEMPEHDLLFYRWYLEDDAEVEDRADEYFARHPEFDPDAEYTVATNPHPPDV